MRFKLLCSTEKQFFRIRVLEFIEDGYKNSEVLYESFSKKQALSEYYSIIKNFTPEYFRFLFMRDDDLPFCVLEFEEMKLECMLGGL